MNSLFARILRLQHSSGPKCPRCGSSDTQIQGGQRMPWGLTGNTAVRGGCALVCRRCGYRAIMFRD
ncbi:MAG: hypothetical protein SPL30_00035 [Succinivibrio sp.]|jgi:DNA-directed RNA polymerase subunit RPC12/RpoP|nr:hypothetical protein [Succinivibrio sp.]